MVWFEDNNNQQNQPEEQSEEQPVQEEPTSQPEPEPEQPVKPEPKPARPARKSTPAKAKGLTKAEIRQADQLLQQVRGPLRPAVQTFVRSRERDDDASLAAVLASGKLDGALTLAREISGADSEMAKTILIVQASADKKRGEDVKHLEQILEALRPDFDAKHGQEKLIASIINNIDAVESM